MKSKHFLSLVILLTSFAANAQLPDLCGIWYSYQYGCEGAYYETFYIGIYGDSIIATKIIGDPCVTGGHRTWEGIYDSTYFLVEYYVGQVGNPNCCSATNYITVYDSMHVEVGNGINMYKYTCEQCDSINVVPQDYGLPCYCKNTLANSSIFSEKTATFPNPFTTQLQIQYTITQPGELIMYDALGRKVKSCSLPSSQKTLQLSLSELRAGIYLVAINSGGQSFTQKVVKE